ncbi:MAG: hypothetical protein H0W01_14555 [Pseudonocardiales bacterium]|nr:hypothetical protein [Pseudonocardiales bacterium]
MISRQQRRDADEQTAYQAMVAGSPTEPDQPAEAPSDDATPEVSAAEPVEVTSDAAPVESEAPIRPSSKPRRTRAAARPSPTPKQPAAATNEDVAADDEYEFVPLFVDLEAMDRPASNDGWDAVGNRRPIRTPSPSPSPTARAMRRTGPGPDGATRRAVASADGEARAKGRKRRTQAIALFGAAGILAGGGGWVVSNANASSDPRAVVGTPAQPANTSAQEWVRQAKVSLASVSRQLDIVAQVEELWMRSPGAQEAGAPPAAVQAMLDRKAALEQQRATVQSWLTAFESVDSVNKQLAEADSQLAAIDRALATPTSGPETPQLTQLRSQREFVKQQRDAKAAELASLRNTVDQVIVQPLPDPASEKATEELGQVVVDLASNPDAPEPGQENDRLTPLPAIAYRDSEGEADHEPGTGAPPRPGRGSNKHNPEASERDGGGVVEEVVEEVSGESGGGESGGHESGGVVEEVVDQIGGGKSKDHGDPASYNADPSETEEETTDTTGNGGGQSETTDTTGNGGTSAGASSDGGSSNGGTGADGTGDTTETTTTETVEAEPAPVGKGPNGEVLTTKQQIRYDGLQERREVNDAKTIAEREVYRKAKQKKLDKMRKAEDKKLTPLQRQKKDIAREAKDLKTKSKQKERDKLTLARRDEKRAKLDANQAATFRTGVKPKTSTAAAKTKADEGKKQRKTATANATSSRLTKQQKATTTAAGNTAAGKLKQQKAEKAKLPMVKAAGSTAKPTKAPSRTNKADPTPNNPRTIRT